MKTTKLIIIFFLFLTTISRSQTPESLIDKFFKDYAVSPSKAIDDIYNTNVWTKNSKEGIENMKREIASYTLDYMGKYYGKELITKQKCTESFELHYYMVKYDRQPMKFVFEFYKPNNKWMLYSLMINADLDEDAEQAAKLALLNKLQN
jgi:hypothetical protein